MSETITVLPADEQRVAFARWAVTQGGRVRTCSHAEFCVPLDLFTAVPEEVLIGALVDGHLYRHVEDDVEPVPAAEPEPVAEVEPVVEDRPLYCAECDREFGTQRGFNKHRSAVHPEGGPS